MFQYVKLKDEPASKPQIACYGQQFSMRLYLSFIS